MIERRQLLEPFGSYQQKRLGFGLTNGPSAYCRLVEKIVSTIPENIAIAFLDDAVIHAKTFDEHIYNLRTTLTAYKKAGLKLSPSKCSFFSSSLTFLGHEVDAQGIRPTKHHVEAIAAWPLPQLKTEAQSFFLGMKGQQTPAGSRAQAVVKSHLIGHTDLVQSQKSCSSQRPSSFKKS